MANEISAKVDALARDIEDLQEEATFTEELDEMVDLEANIEALQPKLDKLRASGYKYKNFLEKKIENLAVKWQEAKPHAREVYAENKRAADPMVAEIVNELAKLRARPNASKLAALETRTKSIQTKVEALEEEVEAIYDGISRTYYQTQSQINQLIWAMEQLSEATFKLNADEALVQAVKAEWRIEQGKKENPEGVLYLTDQRILFERKEKIATKKILFIATQKELVHELMFETPILSVDEMNRHTEGLFRHAEHLDLVLGRGAPFAEADFRLKGQKVKEWMAMIKRTQSGELQRERIGATMVEVTAQVALEETPISCEACGAPMPTLPETQQQYQCSYCSQVMRW